MRNTVYWLYLVALLFAPLAYGAVEPWSTGLVEFLIFLAAALFCVDKIRRQSRSVYSTPGLLPLALIAGFALVQLVPIPLILMKLVSAQTYRIYQETVRSLDIVGWTSLAFNKKAVLMEFYRFTTYGIFYVLTVQLLSDRRLLKKTAIIVVAFGSVIAFLSIIQSQHPSAQFLWFRASSQGSGFGPFVNRNHYAGFIGMLLPLSLSAALYHKPTASGLSLREKLSSFVNQGSLNFFVLFGFASVLLAASMLLTRSRGGAAVFFLSMIFFAVFLTITQLKGKALALVGLTAAILYFIGWFGWAPIFERLETIRNAQGDISDLRLTIWKDSFAMIQDFPLTGAGFGNFAQVYFRYSSIGLNRPVHAHNDYIEWLAEGGLVAAALALWFLIAVAFRSLRQFARRKNPYNVILFAGASAGAVSFAIFGLFDFNFHIPSNGLYFFFLLGLTVASSATKMDQTSERQTYLKAIRFYRFKTLALVAAILLTTNAALNVGILLGRYYFLQSEAIAAEKNTPKPSLIQKNALAQSASVLDPLDAYYQLRTAQTESTLLNFVEAEKRFQNAVVLNPIDSEILQKTGLFYGEIKKQNSIAQQLLLAGIEFDPNNPYWYAQYASWLTAIGGKDKALNWFKKAIQLVPGDAKRRIKTMRFLGLTNEDIIRALPERVEAYQEFADYLSKIGDEGLADMAYLNSLIHLDQEPTILANFFYRPYHYFSKRQRYDAILSVMKKAQTMMPEQAQFKIFAAQAYEQLGQLHEALQAYELALQSSPQNESIQKQIERLKKKIE